jgi:hypothetical protein
MNEKKQTLPVRWGTLSSTNSATSRTSGFTKPHRSLTRASWPPCDWRGLKAPAASSTGVNALQSASSLCKKRDVLLRVISCASPSRPHVPLTISLLEESHYSALFQPGLLKTSAGRGSHQFSYLVLSSQPARTGVSTSLCMAMVGTECGQKKVLCRQANWHRLCVLASLQTSPPLQPVTTQSELLLQQKEDCKFNKGPKMT